MAKTVTLTSLISKIRERGEWRNNYIPDSELTDYINQACYKLYSIASKAEPLRYLKSKLIYVTTGVSEYTLPTDFLKVVDVAFGDSSVDGYSRIESFNLEERYDEDLTSTVANTRYLIKGYTDSDGYSQRGGYKIELQPIPVGSIVLKLDYIADFIDLTAGADTFDCFNGMGEEYVICDVAIKCCAKEETDPSVYMAMKQDAEKILVLNLNFSESGQKTSYNANTLKGMQISVRNRNGWDRETFSDNQLTTWINEACRKFYSMVAAISPLRYLKRAKITVTSGTKEYSLPSDFFKIIGVAVADTTTDGYSQLETFNFEERYDSLQTSAKGSTRFLIHGTDQDGGYKIVLQPKPTWSGELRIEYIPTYTVLEDNADVMDTVNGLGQEWIMSDVAMKMCATKRELDLIPGFTASKQDSEKAVIASLEMDLSKQKTVAQRNTLRGLQLSIRNRGSWDRKLISDNQLTEWINSSISSLYDFIIEYDQSYFISYHDISVVSGTRWYDLPSDFYKLSGVALSDNSFKDGYRVIDRQEWENRYEEFYYNDKYNTKYMLKDNQLYLVPTPTWSGTVRVEYIPYPTELTNPTDTFSWYNRWGEYVVLDVCVKICALFDKNPQVYILQREEVKERVVSLNKVDLAKPRTVKDNYCRRRERYSRYYRR